MVTFSLSLMLSLCTDTWSAIVRTLQKFACPTDSWSASVFTITVIDTLYRHTSLLVSSTSLSHNIWSCHSVIVYRLVSHSQCTDPCHSLSVQTHVTVQCIDPCQSQCTDPCHSLIVYRPMSQSQCTDPCHSLIVYRPMSQSQCTDPCHSLIEYRPMSVSVYRPMSQSHHSVETRVTVSV